MNKQPIAVLGGGNGGHMMAVDLTSRGFKVNFYEHPNFMAGFKATLESGMIESVGMGPRGVFPIQKISTDMAETLADVEWINVVLPANGHDLFFQEMIPHLRQGQKVVIWAGDFGSLVLRRMLEEQGKSELVSIIETNTLPYGTRRDGPQKINLLLVAPHVMAAALPVQGGQSHLIKELNVLFPCIVEGPNVLAAAFNNPNPIVHPPGALLNTGRIEYSGGDFRMYAEGITESVALVIRQIYEESALVAKAFGFEMKHYHDRDFRTKTSVMGVEFDCPFDSTGVIGSIIGPTSVMSRYITEDLPFGLVPRSQLGQMVGVATPVIDAIVNIGVIVCREDFWKSGRTLKKMGLAGLVRADIQTLLTN